MKRRFSPLKIVLALAIVTLSPLRSVSQTNMVGSLGGEIVVSPTGAASYSIPIEVVPGTNGMQPSLAITYNSAAGRGLLGIGWDLAGLSSITRIPRTNFYDGVTGSVNFDGNDRLALDGARLIKLSNGNYFVANAVYGTETENFTRVKLEGVPNEDSQHFTAVTQDGSVVEYGNTPATKQFLSDHIYGWWIGKVTDPDGNFMTFNYTGTGGEKIPTRIAYTGNMAAGLCTYATVDFHYTADPYENMLWIGGHAIDLSHLLSGITVCYGADTVRSYCFEYDYGRDARLTAIILKDGSGNEMTRTTVVWGEDNDNATFMGINGMQGYKVLPGDFTGDNIGDLFLFQYNSNTDITTWLVKAGDGNGGYDTSNLSGSVTGSISPDKISVVDFNRDGIDDIGFASHISGEDDYAYQSICFNGVGYSMDVIARNETGGFFLGDFMGIGRIQVLSVSDQHGGDITLDLENENVTLSVPSSSCIRVTDLNGNGKSDLHVHHDNRLDVYEYNEISHDFEKVVDGQWMPYTISIDAMGDFNGDGMQDYAFVQGNATYMKMSKGNDYTSAHLATCYNNIPSQSPMFVADLNGDGKDDIIRAEYNLTFPSVVLHVFYSRCHFNDVVFCDTVQITDPRFFNNDPNMYHFADLNGDGKADLLFNDYFFNITMAVTFPERREHDLVASVTNGLGASDSLEYGFYNTPPLNSLGVDGKRFHYPLVRKLRQSDGVGGTKVTTFSYYRAVFDKARQQVLGFKNHETYCKGNITFLTFKYDSIFHYLSLEQAFTTYCLEDESPGGYVADTSNLRLRWNCHQHEIYNTPDYLSLPYGRFVPYNRISSNVNLLENTQEKVYSWLNSTGRVVRTATIHKKFQTGNDDAPWLSRDSTDITYMDVVLPNGNTVVKPYAFKTWSKRYGCSEMPLHKYRYTFSSGRVDTKVESDSYGIIDTTFYTYNSFGLPLAETLKPKNLPERTTTYEYDSRGRFVRSQTDVLGHTQSATFDFYTCLPSTETDVNGLTTQYQYDAFGRVTRVTRPDGTVHNTSYHWNDGRTFPEAVYYVKETETGTPETRTYYDIFGRVVHTYQEGLGYSDIVYDDKGRVVRKTIVPYLYPATQASAKKWHNWSYDDYGRVIGENDHYTNLSYSYHDYCSSSQNHYVTVTDSIRNTQRTTTYDVLGRVVSSVDAGGTVGYSYGYRTISGKIRDVMTVSIGNDTTTVVSDIRGNRISIQDPDAGTVTSTYNSLNQLVTRTDANGNQASYTYDLAGRAIRTVYSKGADSEVALFTYDNAPGKGVGKIASVEYEGVLESEYVYDALGRLANYKVHDGNEVFEHQYAYDTLGRLQFLTYPDGFRIKQSYNDRGELEKIRNATTNSLIYSVERRNTFRQPQITRFGNGTGTAYSYDDYGMLTGITNGNATTTGGGVTSGDVGPIYFIGNQYRELTYTYNDRGFIESKADAKTDQSEKYFYDNLDRLISYKVNNVTAASFTYGNNGNITANSRVGSYSYDGAKPHAVTSVAGNAACPISPSQCDVTYNLRNRPATISENGYNIAIDYDASGMRRHTVITAGNTLVKEKTRVSNLYEIESTATTSRRLDYIYAEGSIIAVRVYENGIGSLYYVLTDHLGSWEKVMSQSKTTVQQTHFDPWGNRMSYTDWNTPQTQTSFTFDRGFTGHEHYDSLHIINANARLYDPVIGRFFSPDPFVQAPDFTQAYNRYSYCMNNPVMYSDPDGESILAISMIVGAVVCAYIGGTAANGWKYNPCSWSWDGKTWAGIGLGAVAGAAAGFAFAYAAPALASTAFMSYFGASGVITSYTLSGFATLGAGGYASGFGGGMLYSNGDAHYSHLSGVQGFKVGATVGALAGHLAGDIVSYEPPQQPHSIRIEPENKWKGNYFQGTEEEARQSLVETSMLFKTETAMWCTSRGYYFEPISGDHAYSYRAGTYCCDENGMPYKKLLDLNVDIGYKSNTINTTNTFSILELINNELYLYPKNGPASKVYYHAHTHPQNSGPSDADNLFSYFLGIRCRIYGWNGCVYYYGGPGYWH